MCDYLEEKKYFDKKYEIDIQEMSSLGTDKKKLNLAEIYKSINEKITFYSGLLNMNPERKRH